MRLCKAARFDHSEALRNRARVIRPRPAAYAHRSSLCNHPCVCEHRPPLRAKLLVPREQLS